MKKKNYRRYIHCNIIMWRCFLCGSSTILAANWTYTDNYVNPLEMNVCQTLRLMYADTPIARIWQNREWIPRHYSTSWGIRIYRSQWKCTRISDSMMLRKNWNGWKSLGKRRRRLNRRRRNRCRRRCSRQFNMEDG